MAHPVNMIADWIKNTLLSLGTGKQFCHVLSTLILVLCLPWRLYSMWQRRARDSFSWHPGTSHTDTLLWSATLILIKRCLTRAHEDQGCWGAGGSINTRLNEGRRWAQVVWQCRWHLSPSGSWVSPLPPPLQGAQQQRLHFNYQVHLVLRMGHHRLCVCLCARVSPCFTFLCTSPMSTMSNMS